MSFYLALENGQSGPHSKEEILEMLASGCISPQQLTWQEGMAEWQPLSEFLRLQPSQSPVGLPPIPPIAAGPGAVDRPIPTQINWVPALLLQAVALVLGIVIDLVRLGGNDNSSQRIFLLCLPVLVATIVLWSLLHYRCWRALPAPYAKTTPGKAVGFLFIPFYNFYWIFISVVELAKGFVSHATISKREIFGDPTGIGVAFSVLFVCTFTIGLIPGLSSLIGIASFVLFILYYRVVVQYANAAIASSQFPPPSENNPAQAHYPNGMSAASLTPPPFSGVNPHQNP